ncbi:ankyrin repeat-containing domain protein [Gorgonomyces haynaldii]|nr:ankyrin repeat-containing domain protein [Gorgonomyces haynaldii]
MIQHLPHELLKIVSCYLNPKEYMRLHGTCQSLYDQRQPCNFAIACMEDLESAIEAPLSVLNNCYFDDVVPWVLPLTACRRGALQMLKRFLTEKDVKRTEFALADKQMPKVLSNLVKSLNWKSYDTPAHCNTVSTLGNHSMAVGSPVKSMNHTPIALLLLERVADPTIVLQDIHSLLVLCIMHNNAEIRDALIQNGLKVACDEEVLRTAVIYGTPSTIEWVFEQPSAKITISEDCYILLRLAASNTMEHVQRAFKEAGLNGAAFRGRLDIMEWLLEGGTLVDVVPDLPETPMSEAARGNEVQAMKMLLLRGASPHIGNENKSFSHTDAAASNAHSTVMFLILWESRIIEWSCRNEAWGALHVGQYEADYAIYRLFVQNSGNVNAKDYEDMTPLNAVAQGGDSRICRYLIKHGADIHHKDCYGRNALSIAAVYGHRSIARDLLERGVEIPETMPDMENLDIPDYDPLQWLRDLDR